MKNISRRNFIEKSLAAGAAGLIVPTEVDASTDTSTEKLKIMSPAKIIKDDISLAQWALVQEVRDGKWKTLDFAKVAREDFDINGIEFVNTLMEVPTLHYQQALNKNAKEYGVTNVLIMVDAEAEPCSSDRKERELFNVTHRKWIDIANYLGCHAIRTNCRGPEDVNKAEALKWAAESYNMLLEYAVPAGISVCIENHGGVSNDADWMVSLMEEVDNLYFGSYPDWRRPSDRFDNVNYLDKMLPWATGMSYRNQPEEEQTAKMIKMCQDGGYKGWYGIESGGRDEIKMGKKLLEKYLEL
ncbi:sugar phosphate isomerase/epimerase family protein [Bacteroidota bacterium]